MIVLFIVLARNKLRSDCSDKADSSLRPLTLPQRSRVMPFIASSVYGTVRLRGMGTSAQAQRFFVIYDSQFPLASSRFGRDSIQYRVGKTHCQGHQDPSKRVFIFLGETEALIKMVSI